MVIFESVSKFVLSDITFCVPKGEIVGIIGPSGAGKTTLLKLACGLLEAQSGKVCTFRKNPVSARRRIARELAAVFADIPVFGEYDTVKQGFEDIRTIYGIGKKDFSCSYAQLGERLGFAAYEGTEIRSLSLGQKRRAELGIVFVRNPKLIVLDEPGVGLDQSAKAALHELLRERQEAGATILISSHDMDEISDLCGRILLLDRGRVAFYGAKELLLRRYAPMDVCELDLEPAGRVPSFEDLPIGHYELNGNHLLIRFNSNRISSAELLSHIMAQTKLCSVRVRKGNLLDTVKNIAEGDKKL